jgi:hypothetical protein
VTARPWEVVNIVVGIGCVLATLGGFAALATSGADRGSLSLSSDWAGVCYSPPARSDWTEQAQYGLVFGLDFFTLRPAHSAAEVVNVSMIEPTEGIQLRLLAFVPSGGIGYADDGKHGLYATKPELAPFGKSLPARLSSVPAPAGHATYWKAHDWQLVVNLRAPSTSAQASVSGFTVTYFSGGLLHQLRTQDSVRIGTASCSGTRSSGAAGTSLRRPRGEVGVGRVADVDQREPVRGHDGHVVGTRNPVE